MPEFNNDNYPIIPVTPNWENPYNFESNINKSQNGGEGAVISRSLKGINPLKQTRQINVNLVKSKFLALESFLTANKGEKFRLSLDGGTTTDGILYRLVSWQWTYLGTEVRNFTAEIKQIRKFC